MIDALVLGRLHGAPIERQSSNGNHYVTAKLRVSVRDGQAYFVNVICFDEASVVALMALGDRDSVALSGELTVKTYTANDGEVRPSLDLLAHAVLTPYHVQRKRQAVAAEVEA